MIKRLSVRFILMLIYSGITLVSCVTNFKPAPAGPDDTLVVAKLEIGQTLPPGTFLMDGL